jgi:hypothetical protein
LSQPVGLNFRSRIPTFSDDASVVEAFKVYHYGVDDYSTQPIPDDSIEGNFRTISTSLTAVNSTISALGTTYVPRISSTANPNIITPETLSVVPLTIRGVASQSENLQRWQSSNSTNLAIVFSNGAISSNSYLNVGATTQSTTTALNVVVGNPAHKGVVVRQSGSQTANPQEWQNSTGDTIATVSPTGYLAIGTNVSSTTTAADIRIANSAHRGISVRSATSQTANIQEWQNSSGSALSWVDPTGAMFSVGNEVATNISVNTELEKKIDYETPVNTQSGTTYTFLLDDARKITAATNASGKTFTIPPQTSVTWLANTILRVVNYGAGSLTIAGGSGVTVTNSTTTFGPNEGGSIIRTGSNSWTVVSGGGGGFANFSNSPTGTYLQSGVTYKYITYTVSGSITVTKAGFLDILLVGGGGGSSFDGNNRIGGGGAGGVRYGAFIVPVGTYTITVGSGGGGAANFAGTGTASSFGSIVSVGGGSGGNSGFVSQISSAGGGGSGGGFFFDANQSGGGTSFGGGAGPGGGTSGISLSYVGSPVTYGVGGTTGGGTPNRGNGGGAGGSGGSGIVVVRTRS